MKNDKYIYLGIIALVGIVAYFMISQANQQAEAARAQAAALMASKSSGTGWLDQIASVVPKILSFFD